MLPCAPPCIELRYLYPSRGKLWERPDPYCTDSQLHKADKVVEAVKNKCRKNVWDDGRFVKTDLLKRVLETTVNRHNEILTAGRTTTKPTICMQKNSLYDAWRTEVIEVNAMMFKKAIATKPQATSGWLAWAAKVPFNDHLYTAVLVR